MCGEGGLCESVCVGRGDCVSVCGEGGLCESVCVWGGGIVCQ